MTLWHFLTLVRSQQGIRQEFPHSQKICNIINKGTFIEENTAWLTSFVHFCRLHGFLYFFVLNLTPPGCFVKWWVVEEEEREERKKERKRRHNNSLRRVFLLFSSSSFGRPPMDDAHSLNFPSLQGREKNGYVPNLLSTQKTTAYKGLEKQTFCSRFPGAKKCNEASNTHSWPWNFQARVKIIGMHPFPPSKKR